MASLARSATRGIAQVAALFGLLVSDGREPAAVALDRGADSHADALAEALADPRDLGPLLEAQRAAQDLPAVAAVVLRGGEIVARGAVGERCIGSGVAVTTSDRWHLGSCTKAITAALVARLVERGDLTWDTRVLEAIPALAEGADAAYAELDLGDLLRHRSGFGREHEDRALWAELWKREGTPVEQRARLARAMLAKSPAVEPGRYGYSNANYALAGHVAEVVTGTPYEELVARHVFAPLGITSAGFGVPWIGDPPSQPFGHGADGKPVPPGPLADNPPAITPGGTVHLALDDWARFVAVHVAGARGERTPFLGAASFDELFRSLPIEGTRDSYACGWIELVRPWAKGTGKSDRGRCLTHTGTNNSFVAVCWIAPELDLAVLVVTNRGGGDATTRADAVVGAVLQDALANR